MIFTIIITAILIGLDQLVKLYVLSSLPLHGSSSLIPHVVDLYYIQNIGAGWGILAGRMSLLVFVTLLAIGYICYLIYRNRNQGWYIRLAYALLLAGAIGNLIDRLRLGYVVDMFRLKFIDFPIFNVADIALSCGAMLLIAYLLFNKNAEDVL